MKASKGESMSGRKVALGGRGPGIKSFTQGHPKPGVSAWSGKNPGGGKMNLKTGSKV